MTYRRRPLWLAIPLAAAKTIGRLREKSLCDFANRTDTPICDTCKTSRCNHQENS